MIAPTEPIAAGTSLAEIEKSTRRYADARGQLAEIVAGLNHEIEALKRKALPLIKASVNRTAEREAELRALIEASPALFTKPRTVIFHGIKVGFQKGKGTLEIPDPEDTLARIRRMFAEEAGNYIAVKESPSKGALINLSAAELKKLGCLVSDTGDEVVIRPTDTAVDKIVDALLKDATATE